MRKRARFGPPEALEGRLVPTGIELQGTLRGYLDDLTALGPGAIAPDNASYHLHALGSLVGLGAAYGGGIDTGQFIEPDYLVQNQLLTINGDSGSITVQVNEVATVPVATPAASGSAAGQSTATANTSYGGQSGEVATYRILGGTGAFAGASGQGGAFLAMGPTIQIPGDPSGTSAPTFTLEFLEPIALGGSLSGTATVTSENPSLLAGTANVEGTGTGTTIGDATLTGSLAAADVSGTAEVVGQVALNGSQGSITLGLNGSIPIPAKGTATLPASVQLKYTIVSGTGIYQDLVDNGTVLILPTSTPSAGPAKGSLSGSFQATLISDSLPPALPGSSS